MSSQQLIQALQSPAVYHHNVEEIRLIETHISWVVLTGPYAYKIKKPVDLGFVDFTTLEKRRFYCDEELRLNSRLAPSLYLDVTPVTGTAQAPRVDGPGSPIEFAVKMQQFPQSALLSHRLAQGALLPEHVDSLAAEVADFHGRIDVADPQSCFGTPKLVREPVWENFRHLLIAADEDSTRARIRRLQHWCDQEFESRQADVAARKQDGFVRECHGDMHLGNMILLDETVIIFDCIEFNENFRWIDVMSEVAFCVMDLEDRSRPDLAHRFLNGYLEITGDYRGLVLLAFYLVYRAMVRAKVAGIRFGQEGLANGERRRLRDELHSYLELAERYTEPAKPAMIITHGCSGSGKTQGTQPLVEQQGAVRIRSDVERKRLFGLCPLDRSDSRLAVEMYSDEASRRTYDRLAKQAASVIQAGFPAIVDAAFLKRSERAQFRAVAEELRVPFLLLDFRAAEQTLRERISRRDRQGGDASEANLDVLAHQLKTRERLEADERSYVFTVDCEAPKAPQRLVEEVRNHMG